MLPGGFSYGDYLRCGALARFSPAMEAVADSPQDGGLVLGICNGFQILCEAGSSPACCARNESLSFVCRDVPLVVERTDTPFTSRCDAGQRLVIPVKHGEGCWYADEGSLDELEANGQIVLRYAGDPNGSLPTWPASSTREGNVMGLMPHPEHAVDPLLGSPDGALILSSLVEAARDRRSRRLARHHLRGAPRRAPGCSASAVRSRSRSRARSVTGPRRVPPVV